MKMLRFALLAVLFAAVCAVPINFESNSANQNVTVVDNHDDFYLAKNPGTDVFESKETYFKHTFGNKANGKCDNHF